MKTGKLRCKYWKNKKQANTKLVTLVEAFKKPLCTLFYVIILLA